MNVGRTSFGFQKFSDLLMFLMKVHYLGEIARMKESYQLHVRGFRLILAELSSIILFDRLINYLPRYSPSKNFHL
jgi:hypothetical protein